MRPLPFIDDSRDGVSIDELISCRVMVEQFQLTQHASDDHANGQGSNCIPHDRENNDG